MQKLKSLSPQQILIGILLVALLTRVAVALVLGNTVSGLSGAQDEITYSMLGERFATGHGLTFPSKWYPWIEPDTPQSYFSYIMSFFLAGIYTLVGYQPLVARLIMALISTGIVYMVYLLGRRLFDQRIALIAAAISAVYAYLIFYGVTLVTETPFTLAALIAIYLALEIRDQERAGVGLWIGLGLALMLAVQFRMAVVFFVPLLLLWILWERRSWRTFWLCAIPSLLIVVSIIPFTIRNYQLWGHFSLLQTQFGHVFWNGNHPNHQGNFHPYVVWDIPDEVLATKNDVEITNTLLAMGMENIRNDPAMFVQLTATRLREFFTFWPTQDSSLLANLLRVFSFGVIVPFALYGFLANLRRWRDLMPIYLLMLVHIGLHAVTWTMIRYRVPMDPFFIMFAAYTLDRIYVLWRRRTAADRQVLSPATEAHTSS